MLFTIAVLIAGLAWNTWQSLHKKHERMTSDHGVKMLALSRSSLIVGGLFSGGYGGYALSFVPDLDTRLGSARVWHAGTAAVAGVLLVVAGAAARARLPHPGGGRRRPRAERRRRLSGVNYLSMSPTTKNIEPRIATRSATTQPPTNRVGRTSSNDAGRSPSRQGVARARRGSSHRGRVGFGPAGGRPLRCLHDLGQPDIDRTGW